MKMKQKKIIPCLDTLNGRVVKGTKFVDLKDTGDPVEFAKLYVEQGADELVLLDITATYEKRATMVEVVKRVAKEVSIPFAVGGGIRTIEEIENVLNAGADKVGINTAAVKDPSLIKQAAEKFGSKCIVVAIDAQKKDTAWEVYINGGRDPTGKSALDWALEVEKLGAGEILLTSIDKDGTKSGFDIELTRTIAEAVKIPVTASGGVGKLEDFYLALTEGKADAALAASVFHYKTFTVKQVKDFLKSKGVEVK